MRQSWRRDRGYGNVLAARINGGYQRNGDPGRATLKVRFTHNRDCVPNLDFGDDHFLKEAVSRGVPMSELDLDDLSEDWAALKRLPH